MFTDFLSSRLNLWYGKEHANAHRYHKQSSPHLAFFFLKFVVCFGFEFVLCLFFFLLRNTYCFFFCTILALEDSTPIPYVLCLFFFLLRNTSLACECICYLLLTTLHLLSLHRKEGDAPQSYLLLRGGPPRRSRLFLSRMNTGLGLRTNQ